MDKLSNIVQRMDGKPRETNSARRTQLSKSTTAQPESAQMTAAKQATERLLDLLPPLDVNEPEAFIAAIVAIFANYPPAVMASAIDPVRGIPSRADRPTLKLVKAVCEEIYGPMVEAQQRADGVRQARLAIGPPRRKRTPEEQARADALADAARAEFGILPGMSAKREVVLPPSADAPISIRAPALRDDGRHATRIAADLAARAARNRNQTEEVEP